MHSFDLAVAYAEEMSGGRTARYTHYIADDNGNWISYSEDNSYNDDSVIDATGGGGNSSGVILPDGSSYDPSVDYSDYEGNSDYGYYNEHGVWESYY